ncbi:MAG: phosphotransferase enzyme family protein, partial [Devosia sp.]|uniref:phosphotransferase family protein n=1 Tax=Devosia sp. TaxID=1871048 RepID=UPI00260CBCCE
MEGVPAAEIARFRALVIGTLPQFAGGIFVPLTGGWDSVALECDGWIFKFARNERAEARLRREAALLAFLKPRVTMQLPQMVLHEGPVPFSRHLKIPGSSLESAQYAELDEGRRNALAMRMAQFYAELHALPLPRMQQVGAVGVDPWMAPGDILAGAGPKLPRGYKGFLERTVAAYRKLSISGDELVYGY